VTGPDGQPPRAKPPLAVLLSASAALAVLVEAVVLVTR
jgi:hypothetical protein